MHYAYWLFWAVLTVANVVLVLFSLSNLRAAQGLLDETEAATTNRGVAR